MGELIQESVNVATALTYSKLMPSSMLWKQRTYTFCSCSMQYSRHDGDVLLHIFYMTTNEACMQLIFNTTNLKWTLAEIASL